MPQSELRDEDEDPRGCRGLLTSSTDELEPVPWSVRGREVVIQVRGLLSGREWKEAEGLHTALSSMPSLRKGTALQWRLLRVPCAAAASERSTAGLRT